MTFALPVAWPLFAVLALLLLGLSIAGLVRGGERGARLAWALRILAVVLLVIVAARPQLPGGERGPSVSGGLEVYVAIDTTSSMAAEDLPGGTTRLDAAKADIAAIAEALPGAQFSLVSFDAAAIQRVPLTADGSAIVSAASVLTQEVTYYSRGSSIDEAVPTLVDILSAASADRPGNDRVLFYLGDGEQTIDTAPGSFAELAPLISGGGVLGYGTEAGGPMREFDGYSDDESLPEYIPDYSAGGDTAAISRIDETALRLVADQLGVAYTHRVDSSPVAPLLDGIEVGELQTDPGEPGGPIELYWIAAIPLGLLLVLELVRLAPVLGRLRDPRRREGVS